MTVHHTRIIEGGKLAIPAWLLKELGFKTGDTVLLEVDAGELRVRSLSVAIARTQDIAARFSPERVLSEELIAERRADAARE